MVYKVLEKKSRDKTAHTGAAIISEDQQLPNELHKPITRKFQKPERYLSYRDKNYDAALAEI